MDELETTTDTRSAWNRRTVLKGAAAGTMLWAVPSVTSLATASAASASFCTCNRANDNSFCQCGASGPLDFCFCSKDVNGNPGCYEDDFCSDLQPCSQDSDCASGQCLDPNNGCGESVCVDTCGTHVARNQARPQQRNARRVSGRS